VKQAYGMKNEEMIVQGDTPEYITDVTTMVALAFF